MSVQVFEILGKETIDKSKIKRDIIKMYNQHGARLNNSDQKIESIYGENNKYHQNGMANLQ